LQKAGLHNFRIQQLRSGGTNEELISLDQKETSEQSLDEGKTKLLRLCQATSPTFKPDLNNASKAGDFESVAWRETLCTWARTPIRATPPRRMRSSNYRNVTKGGVLNGFDDLSSATRPEVVAALKDAFSLSNFGVKNVEIVGPQVGKQLQKPGEMGRYLFAGSMLVYLGFRFEWIYGVAAVLTVFHDTLITVGAFS